MRVVDLEEENLESSRARSPATAGSGSRIWSRRPSTSPASWRSPTNSLHKVASKDSDEARTQRLISRHTCWSAKIIEGFVFRAHGWSRPLRAVPVRRSSPAQEQARRGPPTRAASGSGPGPPIASPGSVFWLSSSATSSTRSGRVRARVLQRDDRALQAVVVQTLRGAADRGRALSRTKRPTHHPFDFWPHLALKQKAFAYAELVLFAIGFAPVAFFMLRSAYETSPFA